jgi:hypothetical protein
MTQQEKNVQLFRSSVTAIENFLSEFTVTDKTVFGIKKDGEVDIFNSTFNAHPGLLMYTELKHLCDYDEDRGYELNMSLLGDFIAENTKQEIEY